MKNHACMKTFPVWELWFSYGKDTSVFDGISYMIFFSIYIILGTASGCPTMR
jgi:hypothetical protein